MKEDQYTHAARQAERRCQHEKAQKLAFADRMLAAEAARLGLPSPRMREASAGPLVFRDGPRVSEMRTIRTAHYTPKNQLHHRYDATCWCGPREEPRDTDGGRTWTHYPLMPAERRVEAGSPGDQRATLEGLAQEQRERGQ